MTKLFAGYNSQIVRITVDEKLGPEFIRILVSDHKSEYKILNSDNPKNNIFSDHHDSWIEEMEVYITPEDYSDKMLMTGSMRKKYPWNTLYEGQVFLSGYFRLAEKRVGSFKFMASLSRRNFVCINKYTKTELKQSYLTALRGGKDNAITN